MPPLKPKTLFPKLRNLETSPVSIAAITGDTLVKLVGGQVVHELSKNGLAGMHPSLSAIRQGARRGGFSPVRAQKSSNRKIESPSYRTEPTAVIGFRKTGSPPEFVRGASEFAGLAGHFREQVRGADPRGRDAAESMAAQRKPGCPDGAGDAGGPEGNRRVDVRKPVGGDAVMYSKSIKEAMKAAGEHAGEPVGAGYHLRDLLHSSGIHGFGTGPR
jgi:hypothetical protein